MLYLKNYGKNKKFGIPFEGSIYFWHYHQISQKLTKYQQKINSPKIRAQAKTLTEKVTWNFSGHRYLFTEMCFHIMPVKAVKQSHWSKQFDTVLPQPLNSKKDFSLLDMLSAWKQQLNSYNNPSIFRNDHIYISPYKKSYQNRIFRCWYTFFYMYYN